MFSLSDNLFNLSKVGFIDFALKVEVPTFAMNLEFDIYKLFY